jgi:hypothetical protein
MLKSKVSGQKTPASISKLSSSPDSKVDKNNMDVRKLSDEDLERLVSE